MDREHEDLAGLSLAIETLRLALAARQRRDPQPWDPREQGYQDALGESATTLQRLIAATPVADTNDGAAVAAGRHYSPEFERNRAKLLSVSPDCFWGGNGCEGQVEVHHVYPWSLWPMVDEPMLRRFLRVFDAHGYGRKRTTPLKSPDDLRNLMLLCIRHHRLRVTGAHNVAMAEWIALGCQRMA